LTPAGLVVDGKDGYAQTAPLPTDLTEKTLEVWVRLDNLDQSGGAALSVQALPVARKIVFDAIAFAHRGNFNDAELEQRAKQRWVAASEFYLRNGDFQSPKEEETNQPVQIVLTYKADGTVAAYRNGKPYGRPYKSKTELKTFQAGKAIVLFGL